MRHYMAYLLTFYTKRFLKKRANGKLQGGASIGPFVFIRPDLKDDIGLHAHEVQHVKQWLFHSVMSLIPFFALAHFEPSFNLFGYRFETLGFFLIPFAVFGLFYKFIPKFRLQMEVEAYKVQANQYNDDRRPLFADYIVQDYNLKITKEEALRLLNKPWWTN